MGLGGLLIELCAHFLPFIFRQLLPVLRRGGGKLGATNDRR